MPALSQHRKLKLHQNCRSAQFRVEGLLFTRQIDRQGLGGSGVGSVGLSSQPYRALYPETTDVSGLKLRGKQAPQVPPPKPPKPEAQGPFLGLGVSNNA